MSDDGECRLWSDTGAMVYRFLYNGGSVTAVLVDEEHRLVLAAMTDMRMRVFRLDDPIPQARCAHAPQCSLCCCADENPLHSTTRRHLLR